ncbi:MAG: nickel pincer cofactor biosynthesis protein LarB [Myxococcales bacterium]|nr:nickel pincer cofactor biosynthesis protein LarB [Myxococcales bacterium]
MSEGALRAVLEGLAAGTYTVEQAEAALARTADLGFAAVDLQRARRRGVPETIFGQGKSVEQIVAIAEALRGAGQRVLVTRVAVEDGPAIVAALGDAAFDPIARCVWAPAEVPAPSLPGTVLVVSAGTTDGPVAAEAACVARLLGNPVDTLADVGVAGLHRLLRHLDRLRSAAVLIVCAGMEGALPSVVAGLVERPVVAVPTSVGYGASFGGMAALLGMLNTCAEGVTVVNIDNGFGAAYAATLMNRIGEARG